MNLAYRYRVKNHIGLLNQMARDTNLVWNYCNDTQRKAVYWHRKWPSYFDLTKLTAGSYSELSISAASISAVCRKYVASRRNRPKLRYRGRRSLGWIPMRAQDIRESSSDAFRYLGKEFRVWKSRGLPDNARIVDGSSFSQDARGRWYLNVTFEIPNAEPLLASKAVGIDLGLHDAATLSTGEKIPANQEYRRLEAKLGAAKRAGKKKQAANTHAKIRDRRKDHLHKASTCLAKEFDYIAVGNVDAARLARTNMAKSVHDVGWSTFRDMLRYKAIARGATYEEVDESFTTQTCSECGSLSGPKGLEGLAIREWSCDCGANHDRDVNAARNILLRSGHRAPVEGVANLRGVANMEVNGPLSEDANPSRWVYPTQSP